MGLGIIIPGASFRGLGLPKMLSFIPRYGSLLKGAYLTGSVWDGVEGAADDYSGNQRALNAAGVTLGANYMEGQSAIYPTTKFSTDDLVGDQQSCTIVGAFRVPSDGPVTPLVQSSEASQSLYIGLHCLPAANTLRAYIANAGIESGDYVYGTSGVEDQYAFFHCRWTPTSVRPGVVKSDGSIGYSTVTTTKLATGPGRFRFLVSGAPQSRMAAAGFYRTALTDAQVLEIYGQMKAKLSGQGITI